LLDALSDSAHDIDADHNGVITMAELTAYIAKHLSHLGGGKQQLRLDQRFHGRGLRQWLGQQIFL
jgi:hypothetical protein